MRIEVEIALAEFRTFHHRKTERIVFRNSEYRIGNRHREGGDAALTNDRRIFHALRLIIFITGLAHGRPPDIVFSGRRRLLFLPRKVVLINHLPVAENTNVEVVFRQTPGISLVGIGFVVDENIDKFQFPLFPVKIPEGDKMEGHRLVVPGDLGEEVIHRRHRGRIHGGIGKLQRISRRDVARPDAYRKLAASQRGGKGKGIFTLRQRGKIRMFNRKDFPGSAPGIIGIPRQKGVSPLQALEAAALHAHGKFQILPGLRKKVKSIASPHYGRVAVHDNGRFTAAAVRRRPVVLTGRKRRSARNAE